MKHYVGQCHCGKIRFKFKAEGIFDAMRCSCSLCRRRGSFLSSFVLEQSCFETDVDAENLRIYKFGTGVATHYFCKNCGIFTHVETRLNPGCIRVNLGCVEDVDIFNLSVEIFDGDSI